MADDISVGSVSADVVPDATGFAARLKAQLSGITVDLGINIDTTEMRSQLAEATRDRGATISVDADTAAAEAEIDTVARTREATVDVNSRGVAQASQGVSGILAAVLALGPALVPVLAVVTALGAGLAAPLAAAGGGLTIFGLLAGKAVSDTNKIVKEIGELKKRAATLVDPKARAAAAAQAKALEASLTNSQRSFLKAKAALSEAFTGLSEKVGFQLFGPLIQGMNLLSKVLPALAPLITAVSRAISSLLREAAEAVGSGGFKDFIASFSQAAYNAIVQFGVIISNLGRGLGNFLSAFSPVSKGIMSGLVGMTAAFFDFSKTADTNKGFQSFIAYVQKTGPKVLSFFGSLVKALVHIAVALAPIGALVLGSIKLLSDAISAIPTPVLGAIASAIIAITLALKAWAIAQAIINALLTANPIGLIVVAIVGLVAALVYAYKNSETFRNIVNNAFASIKAVVGAVLEWLAAAIGNTINFIRDHWKLILGILTGPVGAAAILIISNFDKIKSAGTSVVNWVKSIPGKLASLAKSFGNAGRDLINAFVDGLKNAGGVIAGIAGNVWGAVKRLINGAIDKINAALNFEISIPGPNIHVNAGRIGHLAKGTDNWRGGPTWVGEDGPEIVNLPRGAQVIANNKIGSLAATPAASDSSSQVDLSPASIDRLAAALLAQSRDIADLRIGATQRSGAGTRQTQGVRR